MGLLIEPWVLNESEGNEVSRNSIQKELLVLLKFRLWITDLANDVPECIRDEGVSMLEVQEVEPMLLLFSQTYGDRLGNLLAFLVDVWELSRITKILVGHLSFASSGPHKLRTSSLLTLFCPHLFLQLFRLLLSHLHI